MKGIFCRYLLNSGHQKKHTHLLVGIFLTPRCGGMNCRYLLNSGHQKKHTHLLVGMFFFAQEIDSCQEFANSEKRNVGYRLKE